jgi:hypothetical protein
MTQIRKTLEQQLAEARARKQQVAARLDQLETRKKMKDARMRAWGEKVLVGVVLDAAASRIDLKGTLEGLVADAALKPKEREAALWLLRSSEPSVRPVSDQPAAPSNDRRAG